jgi:hypothetical protein
MIEDEPIRCSSVCRDRLLWGLMAVVTLDPLDPGALTTHSIRASVIIADLDLRVVHVEGPAFDRHGYQPADWPGRLLREVLPPRLMSDLEPRYRAALAGEHQSFDYWSQDGESAYRVQITPGSRRQRGADVGGSRDAGRHRSARHDRRPGAERRAPGRV